MISVLGNHDYGDYQRWSNKIEKEENFKNLLEIQKKIKTVCQFTQRNFTKLN